MTESQRLDWPRRSAWEMRSQRAPWLILLLVVGALVLYLLGVPASAIVGSVGLVLDIFGVWTLAEGLLLSDEDIEFHATWDGNDYRYLLQQRDRRHAHTGLCLAISGF